MKILITGFDAFGGEKINPSTEALKNIRKNILDCEVITTTLPTVFNESFEKIKEEITKHDPKIVICVGQAGGRKNITVERVAINIDDARIADNKNNQPVDEIIRDDGENAYFSTLPIKAIIENLNENNIPAEISNSAGTFVCNHIMYQTLYLANKNNNNFNAGFIHIPYLPEQTINNNLPSMSLDTIVSALENIIETSIKFYGKNDLKINAGKEH